MDDYEINYTKTTSVTLLWIVCMNDFEIHLSLSQGKHVYVGFIQGINYPGFILGK